MSSLSVVWNVIQEIEQKSFNPNKAIGLDRISPRDLSCVSPLMYKGSSKFL